MLNALKQDERFQFEMVLTKGNIHYNNFHDLGIPLHIIERKWIKKDPRIFFLFFKLILRVKPDLIHVWGHMPAVYALPAKLLLGIPMINSEIADSTPGKSLLVSDLVFRFSDRILSNSLAGLVAYKAPESKSRVIYNGFCFSRIKNLNKPEVVRENLNIQTPFLIGMVASFLKNKDYNSFIRAALDILRTRRDISFLCIGDGNSQGLEKVVPVELKSFILFPGKQSSVEQIMNACDVGVLTTNTAVHGEGISNSLMEFMALGKPVIATRFGGTNELIQDGENGFLISAFDIKSLTEKILWLINNEEERGRIGTAAHKTVKSKFSLKNMTEEFVTEYLQFVPKNHLLTHENSNDGFTAA